MSSLESFFGDTREDYREQGLSPIGNTINPKHFKDRWRLSDSRLEKEQARKKELQILKNFHKYLLFFLSYFYFLKILEIMYY